MDRHDNKVISFRVRTKKSGTKKLTLYGNSYILCNLAHMSHIYDDHICAYCEKKCNNPAISIRNMRYSDVHGKGTIGFANSGVIDSQNYVLCSATDRYYSIKDSPATLCYTCKTHCTNPVSYFSIARVPNYKIVHGPGSVIARYDETSIIIMSTDRPMLCDAKPKYKSGGDLCITCLTCKTCCNNPIIRYEPENIDAVQLKISEEMIYTDVK